MAYSVPTSPAVPRAAKVVPLTPQRSSYNQQRSLSLYRSPVTPLTSPYTPINLRSFNSDGSSTVTTPENSVLSARKRLNFTGSPEVVRNVADIAENWRSRAEITQKKSRYMNFDDSGLGFDDSGDMSFSEVANESSVLSDDEALGAPFLSNSRKPAGLPTFMSRPRSQSHAPIPSSRELPTSPLSNRNPSTPVNTSSPVVRRSARHSISLLSTPPPNRMLMRQLKTKGSLTDPPQTRRREALETVTISNNVKSASASMTLEPDTSLNLYDIHENEFEYDIDYQGPEVNRSCEHQQYPVGYPSFPPALPQQNCPLSFGQANFADLFHPGRNFNDVHSGSFLNFGESLEHHFHAAQQRQPQLYFNDVHQPIQQLYNSCLPPPPPPHFNRITPQTFQSPTFSIPSTSPLPSAPISLASCHPIAAFGSDSDVRSDLSPTDCSVCLASKPSSLAILQPCGHPLCSTCLTSALNIVGEKDMECAVCKKSVADFQLVMTTQRKPSFADLSREISNPQTVAGDVDVQLIDGFRYDASREHNPEFDDAFEFGLGLEEVRASTPKTEQQIELSHSLKSNVSMTKQDSVVNVVLRIDNVPWDITPFQIKRWLQQPVERVYVLLDHKGKTLSHAYVEVDNSVTAGAILRGEALSLCGEKEIRGSVLGRGKRARGVTITKSGQLELMRDLFPHWRSSFEGSRPSLAGLENDWVISTLEGGLLTEGEVTGLLQLIREPDSHFLKVPCLPFHSLTNLLVKLPADISSRSFWSTGVRDILFEATYAAIQILQQRIGEAANKTLHDEEYTPDLLADLFHNALRCTAFTSHQLQNLTQLGDLSNLRVETSVSCEREEEISTCTTSTLANKAMKEVKQCQPAFNGSLDDLAKEFGVETQVIEALAQRLSALR